MIIGYAHVSTIDQSLNVQIDTLTEHKCDEIFQEKVSNVKNNRLELMNPLRMLRKGDTFVVYKLDRLAHSTKRLIEVVDILRNKEMQFISIQDKIDTVTVKGKAMFGMLSALAEFEKDIIKERARGRKGGRPRVDDKKLKQAITLYHLKQMSVREIQEATGISRATLYRSIEKEKKIKDLKT